MNGARLGTAIVCTGGLIFILANSTALPAAATWTAIGIGIVAFVLTIHHSVLRTRPGAGRPVTGAFRTYWISVVVMVLAFLIGTQLLLHVWHATYLIPLWIAFAVGAHFIPFRRAFGAPVFLTLGVWMMLVSAVFAVLAVLVNEKWAAVGAVVNGLSMIVCMYAGPDLGVKRAVPSGPQAVPTSRG